MHHDPHWPRASAWLASSSPQPKLAVLGLPVNQSITPGNCHLAPDSVRDALWYFSTYDIDLDHNLADLPIKDFGNVLETALAELLPSLPPTVIMGGDNGVTRLGVHAMGLPLDRIGLITLDAHFDLRHTDDGFHNGNPIRALLEAGMPGTNIHQIGIQSFANSPDYARIAKDAGITVRSAEWVHTIGIVPTLQQSLEALSPQVNAIYIDLDIDTIDRAACPGAPGSRPGGIHAFQARQFARVAGAHPKVRVMDIVEFDPVLDQNRVTAMACAACLLSFASGVLSQE